MVEWGGELMNDKGISKPNIPPETLEKIKQFFLETSIPRLLEEEEKEIAIGQQEEIGRAHV